MSTTTCPKCAEAREALRTNLYLRERDATVAFRCETCGHVWPREGYEEHLQWALGFARRVVELGGEEASRGEP